MSYVDQMNNLFGSPDVTVHARDGAAHAVHAASGDLEPSEMDEFISDNEMGPDEDERPATAPTSKRSRAAASADGEKPKRKRKPAPKKAPAPAAPAEPEAPAEPAAAAEAETPAGPPADAPKPKRVRNPPAKKAAPPAAPAEEAVHASTDAAVHASAGAVVPSSLPGMLQLLMEMSSASDKRGASQADMAQLTAVLAQLVALGHLIEPWMRKFLNM